MLNRFLALLFFVLIAISLIQCGRRGGTLTGGPKDIDPPILIKSEPENLSTNFKAKKIRLTFNEYIKIDDLEGQLIVSPPFKHQPNITPQGGAQKYVEIEIKDTLTPNTTYTINFGQSIQDNNEGNPSSFLTYVFSTGDFIDSLEVLGVVKDGFNQKVDQFVSVMLYEIDSTYSDSTIYKKPPNYITNTLDSAVIFNLKNIKQGKYAIFALKDEGKNNFFDQNADKIAFIQDTITLPSDSVYLPELTLFKEIPNYSAYVPSFAAKNKIVFGFYGDADEELEIRPITKIPDSIQTMTLKEFEKDTFNFWFTPFEMDSIVFTVSNLNRKQVDTFTVKQRKVDTDSLKINPNQTGTLNFNKKYSLQANTPITSIDTTKILLKVKDSIPIDFKATMDSLRNKIDFDFIIEPEQNYAMELYPGAITDFFGQTNDSTSYRLNTSSYSDYGNLKIRVAGEELSYSILAQLTNEQGATVLELSATEQKVFEFNYLEPGTYFLRVIFDSNANGKWDTGSFLERRQPEKVSYYPDKIEVRANWDNEITFTISN